MALLTYLRTIRFILSPNCANRCGFCRFPLRRYYSAPSLKRWRQLLRQSLPWQATTLHLVSGEPLTHDAELNQTVRYYGFRDPIDYLIAVLSQARDERHGGLLARLEFGQLGRADLQRLRPLVADYVVGLVPFDPALFDTPILWHSPALSPARRIELLTILGELAIPTTVVLLVGIGETQSGRVRALEAVCQLQRRYSHVQFVQIRPFRPRRGTPMADTPPASGEVLVSTLAQARALLPREVRLQVSAMEVFPYLTDCLEAGATDLGSCSCAPQRDMTLRQRGWMRLEHQLRNYGYRLVERLPLGEVLLQAGIYAEALRPGLAYQLRRLEQRHAVPSGPRRPSLAPQPPEATGSQRIQTGI